MELLPVFFQIGPFSLRRRLWACRTLSSGGCVSACVQRTCRCEHTSVFVLDEPIDKQTHEKPGGGLRFFLDFATP